MLTVDLSRLIFQYLGARCDPGEVVVWDHIRLVVFKIFDKVACYRAFATNKRVHRVAIEILTCGHDRLVNTHN